MSYKAIDVSEWQGKIDWQKVKDDGVVAAFIRVGGRYGVSGKIYNDATAIENLSGANKVGLYTGAYFFTQAVNEREAVEEAEFTIKKIKDFRIDMPVVIDTEYLGASRHDKIGRQTRTNVCQAFCERVQRAGYVPMIYGSTSWLNNQLDMSQLSEYQVWVAQYAKKCEYVRPYGIWQYTSTGRINGVNGNCDVNFGYIEYWNGFKPTPKGELDVDGWFGPLSVTAMQKWLAVKWNDGVINGQLPTQKKYLPRFTSITFEGNGSETVIALQRYLGGKGYYTEVDGLLGYDTVLKLQKFLIREKQLTDGKLKGEGRGYFGEETAKAFQRFLNER